MDADTLNTKHNGLVVEVEELRKTIDDLRDTICEYQSQEIDHKATIAQQAERIKELEAMGDRAVVAKSIDVLHEEIAMLNAIKCDCKNIIPPAGPSKIECSDKQMMSYVKKQADQLAAAEKLLIECRSSVRLDWQNYERLLMNCKLEASREAMQDEAKRLHDLLYFIETIVENQP